MTSNFAMRLPTKTAVILFYFYLFLRNNLSAKHLRLKKLILLTDQPSTCLFAIPYQIYRFSLGPQKFSNSTVLLILEKYEDKIQVTKIAYIFHMARWSLRKSECSHWDFAIQTVF